MVNSRLHAEHIGGQGLFRPRIQWDNVGNNG